jgi:hypothetical protein
VETVAGDYDPAPFHPSGITAFRFGTRPPLSDSSPYTSPDVAGIEK